jgi:hypothetical protein
MRGLTVPSCQSSSDETTSGSRGICSCAPARELRPEAGRHRSLHLSRSSMLVGCTSNWCRRQIEQLANDAVALARIALDDNDDIVGVRPGNGAQQLGVAEDHRQQVLSSWATPAATWPMDASRRSHSERRTWLTSSTSTARMPSMNSARRFPGFTASPALKQHEFVNAATSLAEIEKATLRLVALRAARNMSTTAAHLGDHHRSAAERGVDFRA